MEHILYNYSKLAVVVVRGRSINTCRVILIVFFFEVYAFIINFYSCTRYSCEFIRETKFAKIFL